MASHEHTTRSLERLRFGRFGYQSLTNAGMNARPITFVKGEIWMTTTITNRLTVCRSAPFDGQRNVDCQGEAKRRNRAFAGHINGSYPIISLVDHVSSRRVRWLTQKWLLLPRLHRLSTETPIRVTSLRQKCVGGCLAGSSTQNRIFLRFLRHGAARDELIKESVLLSTNFGVDPDPSRVWTHALDKWDTGAGVVAG